MLQVTNFWGDNATRFCDHFNQVNSKERLTLVKFNLHINSSCSETTHVTKLEFAHECHLDHGLYDDWQYPYIKMPDQVVDIIALMLIPTYVGGKMTAETLKAK